VRGQKEIPATPPSHSGSELKLPTELQLQLPLKL
jgi:hypothetical protein